MKQQILILAVMLSPLLSAQVEYARVLTPAGQGFNLHPQAREADFRNAFADFDPQKSGEATDNATFGAPLWLAVRIDSRTYIVQVDNVHGVFTFHRGEKRGKMWIRTRGKRTLYHPALYDRLKAEGLNILSREELSAMSREERKNVLSGKVSPVKLKTEQK